MLPELQLIFCSATKGAFHLLKLAGHTGVVKRIPLLIEDRYTAVPCTVTGKLPLRVAVNTGKLPLTAEKRVNYPVEG